jgi:hypothetical protein
MRGQATPVATARHALLQPAVAKPRFCCRLDEQPDHLVPPRLVPEPCNAGGGDYLQFLNPHCQFVYGRELPLPLAGSESLLKDFALRGGSVWIEDPAARTWQVYELGPNLAAIVTGLSANREAFPHLPTRIRRLLSAAEILVEEGFPSVRLQRWPETVREAADRFAERGYVPLRNLFHPFQISALRRYYRRLVRSGVLPFGDGQNARRYASHNESVACFFHHQLTETVSAIAGQPVKPSYAYFASYQREADLQEHTDRPQCEFSVSFCLDYSPEPSRETPWPLRLHTPTGETAVFQALGDGLLYRGHELPHFRGPLPRGHSSTSLLFHFVPVEFPGPLD